MSTKDTFELLPATPLLDAELTYEATGDDPYPEFVEEQFELYQSLGYTAIDILGDDARKYVALLEKNEKGLHPQAPASNVVTLTFVAPKIE